LSRATHASGLGLLGAIRHEDYISRAWLGLAEHGSAQGLYLIVSDIEAARAELASRGAAITEVFHNEAQGAQFRPIGASGRLSGPAPDHLSYRSYATFNDPDGNTWVLQEVRQQTTLRRFSMLSFTAVTDEILTGLSGNSEARQKAFLEQSLDFFAASKRYFWPYIFRVRIFKPEQFPDIPRFKFVEPGTKAVLSPLWFPASVLALWCAVTVPSHCDRYGIRQCYRGYPRRTAMQFLSRVRQSLRSLIRQPAFSIAVIAITALGVGAGISTAVFRLTEKLRCLTASTRTECSTSRRN
jgi:hypothetical protein